MISRFQIIVVEGPIGVGKTSLAEKLAKDFDRELFLEDPGSNPFLGDFYRNPKQYALATQLHFLLQRARQVENFHQHDLFRKPCVADFMLAKDRLFAELNLNSDELALYRQIYDRLTVNVPAPNLVIYLQAPVSALRRRITQRGIDYEQPIKEDYLTRLSDRYSQYFFDYDDSALLTVNTENLDLVNRPEDYQRLLNKINDIHSGRHYFNQSSLTL